MREGQRAKGENNVWCVGPQLNIVNDIGKSVFMSTFKLNDSIIWHARLSHVHFKRMQDMSKDWLISAFDMDTEKYAPESQLLQDTCELETVGDIVVCMGFVERRAKIDEMSSVPDGVMLHDERKTLKAVSKGSELFEKCDKANVCWVEVHCHRVTGEKIVAGVTMEINSLSDYSSYDAKDSFLEGELDERSYMTNLRASSCLGNENKAFKKQTCIIGSTMESKFIALTAAGKEAEWLKNLLIEIPLWSKPISPISIRCDSAATLVKLIIAKYTLGMGLDT
ncbi:hypothetical protein Tco_0478813 [Tanacetum coccineum]